MTQRKPAHPLTEIPPRPTRRAAYASPRADDASTEQHRHAPDPEQLPEPRRPRHTSDAAPLPDTEEFPSLRKRRGNWFQTHVGHHAHLILATVVITLVCWWLWSFHLSPWLDNRLDHWQYGMNRVASFDLDVGHGGTSHFVTDFYDGHAIVIEFVGAVPMHTYSFPMSSPTDTTPRVVSLEVANGGLHATPGKPDLVVHVTGLVQQLTLYNTGTAFTTEPPQSSH